MLHGEWKEGTAKQIADYYADYIMSEGAGYWHGKYSDTLGFKGEVTREDLIAALNNRTPDGRKITQRDGAKRRRALEFTFSGPKSVSIMEAFGDTRIPGAFDKAVHLTEQFIEQRSMRRLRAKGMNEDVITGNIVAAYFSQFYTRPVNGVSDPQRHGHLLFMNCTKDTAEGKWFALQAGEIMRELPLYQAFFRSTLAQQIQALGYHVKYARQNFEIDGIDKSILDKFSNRTKEVEAAAKKFGITNASSKAMLGRMTRDKKTERYSPEQLKEIWTARLTPAELKQIQDVYLKSLGMGDLRQHDEETRLLSAKHADFAMDNLSHKMTYVPDRKIITLALQTGIGRVSVEHIQNHIDDMTRRVMWVQDLRDPQKKTTRAAKQKDIEVKDLWKVGLGKHEKLGRDLYTVKAPGQPHMESLNKLYKSRDRFVIMRGNIGRNPAAGRAASDLNAGMVQDVNELPDKPVWFASASMDDGDKWTLMKAAMEQDKRVVFWGDKNTSRLEQDLRLEPLRLYDTRAEKPTISTRLKDALTHLLRIGYGTVQMADYGYTNTRETTREVARGPEKTGRER